MRRRIRLRIAFLFYFCLSGAFFFFPPFFHSLSVRRTRGIESEFVLSPALRASFQVIVLDKEKIVVIDGDTIHYEDKRIRLLGVDCPEVPSDFFGGEGQEPYATEAKNFVMRRIQEGKKIELILSGDRDKYGRDLGHIFIDGKSLSLELIEQGLAYETVSIYGDNGFPDLAQKILEMAEKITPPFQRPSEWRRAHRR